MEGDIVAWTPTKIDDIKVGDVVVFRSYIHWPDEKIVVHRVSKIDTDSKGNPILETKGDNNDWTDQAGPHIPEPYIREDHLMGKVLSIGQAPLKIPFIGYLGIWINQGLESLSQPLLLAILLIPLALISWALVRLIRNVKEQKNPLLSLDGGCDL